MSGVYVLAKCDCCGGDTRIDIEIPPIRPIICRGCGEKLRVNLGIEWHNKPVL